MTFLLKKNWLNHILYFLLGGGGKHHCFKKLAQKAIFSSFFPFNLLGGQLGEDKWIEKFTTTFDISKRQKKEFKKELIATINLGKMG